MFTEQEEREIDSVINHMDTFYNEDGPQIEKLDLSVIVYNYNKTRVLGIVSFDPDEDDSTGWVFYEVDQTVEDFLNAEV